MRERKEERCEGKAKRGERKRRRGVIGNVREVSEEGQVEDNSRKIR